VSQYLTVPPRNRLKTFGRLRAFSVAGPTSWNSLADCTCDPTLEFWQFSGKLLKTWNYLRVIKHTRCSKDASLSALYKFTTDIDIE